MGRAPSVNIKSARRRARPSEVAVQSLEHRLLFALHPLTSIPALNSNPTATAQLYLDFDGDPALSCTPKMSPIPRVDFPAGKAWNEEAIHR